MSNLLDKKIREIGMNTNLARGWWLRVCQQSLVRFFKNILSMGLLQWSLQKMIYYRWE